jgi:hypothetical protein
MGGWRCRWCALVVARKPRQLIKGGRRRHRPLDSRPSGARRVACQLSSWCVCLAYKRAGSSGAQTTMAPPVCQDEPDRVGRLIIVVFQLLLLPPPPPLGRVWSCQISQPRTLIEMYADGELAYASRRAGSAAAAAACDMRRPPYVRVC